MIETDGNRQRQTDMHLLERTDRQIRTSLRELRTMQAAEETRQIMTNSFSSRISTKLWTVYSIMCMSKWMFIECLSVSFEFYPVLKLEMTRYPAFILLFSSRISNSVLGLSDIRQVYPIVYVRLSLHEQYTGKVLVLNSTKKIKCHSHEYFFKA